MRIPPVSAFKRRLSGKRNVWPFSIFSAAAILGLLAGAADAGSAECDRLRRAIAEAGRGPNAQYAAAAARQRAEIGRTQDYARQIGCDNHKFLFFGSDPPAQCGQIKAQIGRMRDNLEDLEARGGSSASAGDLTARFNAECAGAKPPGIVDALFGQPKPNDLEEQPLNPPKAERDLDAPEPSGNGQTVAGGKAVCVRSCDGAYFPLSYSASSERANSLSDLCRALCPNAEVTVYTMPNGGEIEQAVSVNGARYMDSPTALRYRKVFDPSCSCRRRGQTWTDALAPAESLLGKQSPSDIMVTPAKSAELSRPKLDAKADPKAKAKTAKVSADAAPAPRPTAAALGSDTGRTDTNGVDTVLRDAAEAISKDGSGIADPAASAASSPVQQGGGKLVDQPGRDGVTHKVRVVGN